MGTNRAPLYQDKSDISGTTGKRPHDRLKGYQREPDRAETDIVDSPDKSGKWYDTGESVQIVTYQVNSDESKDVRVDPCMSGYFGHMEGKMDNHPKRHNAWIWNTSRNLDGPGEPIQVVSCLLDGHMEDYNPHIHTDVKDYDQIWTKEPEWNETP